LIGTPGSSNALAIAKRLGLPPEVIENAETSSAKEDDNVAELINQLQSAKISAEKNKRAAEVSKTATLQLEQEYRLKLQKLAEQEKLLQKQLHEEAFAALRKVKGQIARIRGAKSSSQVMLNSLNEIYTDLSEQLAEFPEEEQRQEFVRQVAIGDEVRIQSLNRVGTIAKMETNTDKVVVQLGMMQMTVQLEDIEMM
jgi:DNA mismatch repair protein MutS2